MSTPDFSPAILAELKKISGSIAEQDTRAERYIKELFDKSPQLKRCNAYKIYTFDSNTAVAKNKLLANVYRDFGYVAGSCLICLNPGGATSVCNIYINGAGNDAILISDLAARYTDGQAGSVGEVKSVIPIIGFDIREIFYDCTTQAAGTVKILVGAWVK